MQDNNYMRGLAMSGIKGMEKHPAEKREMIIDRSLSLLAAQVLREANPYIRLLEE